MNAITLHEHLSGRNCAQKLHPVHAFTCGKVFARCKRGRSRFERLEMIGPDRKQRKIRKRRVPIFLYCSNCALLKMTQEADVFPSFYLWILSHGTRCAGEVAALANNTICGTGVAYHAHVGGRIILEKITSICFCYCKISDVFLSAQPTIRYSDILACHQGILFIHFFSLEVYFGAMLVVVTFVLSDFDGCQYWARN